MTPFDPHPLIAKARKGALSVGEAHALSVHVSGLERALRHRTEAQISRARQESVELMLDASGQNLVVIFPGESEHYVPVPGDNPPLAVKFLIDTLRARRGQTNTVATAGAPTKADLEALARASKLAPKRADLPLAASLDDLGL